MPASDNPHSTAKHTLTLQTSLYKALKKSAVKQGIDPYEIIVKLVEDYTMKDGTLDEYTRKRVVLGRELLHTVVETAKKRCLNGHFTENITLETIKECRENSEWVEKYREYVEDDIFKSGNPLKAINREFGFHIRLAIGGDVKKDAAGKPVNVKIAGEIIQSYTLMAHSQLAEKSS